MGLTSMDGSVRGPGGRTGRKMARGWESKNIEEQQAEAARGVTTPRRARTPEERECDQRRRQLQLALARTQAELLVACHPAHRDMLRLRLESLQALLSEIDQPHS